jgi:hypothetical protein
MRAAPDGTTGHAGAPPRRTLEQAVAVAFEGFRRNAYFVTVDGRQLTDLDTEIAVTPTTDITFVRLLPLVGG